MTDVAFVIIPGKMEWRPKLFRLMLCGDGERKMPREEEETSEEKVKKGKHRRCFTRLATTSQCSSQLSLPATCSDRTSETTQVRTFCWNRCRRCTSHLCSLFLPLPQDGGHLTASHISCPWGRCHRASGVRLWRSQHFRGPRLASVSVSVCVSLSL